MTRTVWRAPAAAGTTITGRRLGQEAVLFPAGWQALGADHCTENRPITYNSTILTHRIRITNLYRGVWEYNQLPYLPLILVKLGRK